MKSILRRVQRGKQKKHDDGFREFPAWFSKRNGVVVIAVFVSIAVTIAAVNWLMPRRRQFQIKLSSFQQSEDHSSLGDLIYPRKDVSVNLTGFPDTLKPAVFGGFNEQITAEAQCQCPVAQLRNDSMYAVFAENSANKEWTDWRCPQISETDALVTLNETQSDTVKLYDWRSDQCVLGSGVWAKWTKSGYHKCEARAIGELLQLRPRMRVADFGSGCGHKLQMLSHWYGVEVMGFDMSTKALAYANAVTAANPQLGEKAKFCFADLNEMLQRSDEELAVILPFDFDVVVSIGYIHYLHKSNHNLVCPIVVAMFKRVKKASGSMFIGWHDTDVSKCVLNSEEFAPFVNEIGVLRLDEKKLFGSCAKSPPKRSTLIYWKQGVEAKLERFRGVFQKE